MTMPGVEGIFVEIWYVSVDYCWEEGFVVHSEPNLSVQLFLSHL